MEINIFPNVAKSEQEQHLGVLALFQSRTKENSELAYQLLKGMGYKAKNDNQSFKKWFKRTGAYKILENSGFMYNINEKNVFDEEESYAYWLNEFAANRPSHHEILGDASYVNVPLLLEATYPVLEQNDFLLHRLKTMFKKNEKGRIRLEGDLRSIKRIDFFLEALQKVKQEYAGSFVELFCHSYISTYSLERYKDRVESTKLELKSFVDCIEKYTKTYPVIDWFVCRFRFETTCNQPFYGLPEVQQILAPLLENNAFLDKGPSFEDFHSGSSIGLFPN